MKGSTVWNNTFDTNFPYHREAQYIVTLWHKLQNDNCLFISCTLFVESRCLQSCNTPT